MVDINALMRAWLLTLPAVTTITGTGNSAQGIYSASDLPEHYDPKRGPAVQMFLTPSAPHPEISELQDVRVQVRCWADVEKYKLARQLYSAVRDALHGAAGVNLAPKGFVIRCIEVTSGNDGSDPDTGWASVTGFFMVMAR